MTALLLLAAAGFGTWNRLPDLPDPEGFAGTFAGVSHGSLLAAGGANFPEKKPWEGGQKKWTDAVYALDKPDGKWTTVGKLPKPLGYGAFGTYAGQLVCAGGSNADGHFSDAFSLELAEGKLQTHLLPPLPIATANCMGTVVGNQMIVVGGQERPDSVIALDRAFSLRLDDPGAQWKELPPLPGEGRILAVAASFRNELWIMGGAALFEGYDGKPQRKYLRDCYRLDMKGFWVREANLPYSVVAAPSPAPTTADAILILGGDDGSLVGTEPTKHPGFPRTGLRYDPDSRVWREHGTLPFGQVTASTAKWNGNWVVVSGEIRPGVRTPQVWSLTETH